MQIHLLKHMKIIQISSPLQKKKKPWLNIKISHEMVTKKSSVKHQKERRNTYNAC